MVLDRGSFLLAFTVAGCPGWAGELSRRGEDGNDAGADLLAKLQAEPYPRVRYFMTVSVPNPDLSAS